MRGAFAFLKKEFLSQLRSGKLLILILVAMLFGVMSPGIAKLTPWMMETMAGSMEESGLVVTAVETTVLSSWTQFYKNAPMAVIIFLLMFGGILTTEFQKGTLVNMVTKGLARWKILGAKGLAAVVSWSVFYWLMYEITYGYNVYFWKDETVCYPGFAAVGIYLVGLWLLVLVIFSRTALNICKRKPLDEISSCIENEEVEALNLVFIEIIRSILGSFCAGNSSTGFSSRIAYFIFQHYIVVATRCAVYIIAHARCVCKP